MVLLADGLLDLIQHEVHVLRVVRLKHADVVGGVDEAVARDSVLEVAGLVLANAPKEVAHHLLVLVVHLHAVHLGDEDRLSVANRRLSEAHDKVVEVGAWLLLIWCLV